MSRMPELKFSDCSSNHWPMLAKNPCGSLAGAAPRSCATAKAELKTSAAANTAPRAAFAAGRIVRECIEAGLLFMAVS